MHEPATPIEAAERDRSSAIPGHHSPRRCIRAGLRTVARRLAGERGAATAEYAVATMAAVGFAGLLVLILRGDEVRGILTDLVRNALTVG